MSAKSLHEQIADIKKAIEAQEGMRSILGDSVVGTTLAVLHDQLSELERQSTQQDDVNQARRKLVTVLFADVSDFTAFSEHRDAEDVANLVNRLWIRADWIIQEYGGRIDKHIGDAVMALWGAETGREDDAERAVRAALQIQETFKDGVGPLPIRLKVGINSGQVLLSAIGTQGEFTAMGDTVNTASRLVHAANGGDILISHNTYQLVRGVFDVQKQTPLMLKGKTEPLQTYIIQRVRPRAFRIGRRGVEGVTTRMVGRETEFQTIQAALEQCVNNGHVTVVVVKGEAGLGKSRLMYEFEAWLDSHPTEFYLFKGRADEEIMRLPYSLLRDVFCDRFQIRDSDTQSEAREKLLRGMAAMTEMASEERASLIGELLGFDFSESTFVRGIRKDARQIRDRSFNSIAQFFTELTHDSPVVLLLDDIHWADNGSLDLIEYLAKLETNLPIFILCAARPSLDEVHPNWGSNFPLCTIITIKSLDLDASRELVGEILQNVSDLPDDLVETVAKNAEGNPFYLEELIKVLIEDGVIVKGEDIWKIVPHRVTQLRVPATLTGVLQARLDRLPSMESEVLERAAVIGRTFWDAAVAAIHGSEAAQVLTGGEDVHSALRALRNKELVFSHQPSTFARAQEFIFKHAILREVTYERVLKAKRKLYHRMAADWLIQQSGERIDEYLGLIAQHYELAGDTVHAVEFLERAADQSMRLSAYREALSASERALAILASSEDKNPAIRARLLLTIGVAHLWLTDHATATARFEECIALARTIHDRDLESKALARLGRIGLEQSKFSQAEEHLKNSLSIAQELDDLDVIAYTLAHLGYINHYQGKYAEAQKYGEESYEFAKQTGDAIAQAFSLNMLAMISVNNHQFEQGRAYHLRAIEICKNAGDRYGLARAHNNLSELIRIQRKYAEAKPYTLEGIKLARELGNRYALPIMLINLSFSQVGLGEIRDAYASLRAALQLNIENDSVSWLLFSLVGFANILAAEGKRISAIEILGLCMHHPETNSDTQRDIQLVLEDLKKVRTDDIEVGLERGKLLDLNKTVVMALGG
ncbi:MAG TPA: adenylate/guanylate cyclase domain-containing protein [Anaerolineales bacterium]|nr:adenylate/guanylate cyclase domain-containing protein [Anaerolineales bacterium]